MTTLEIRGGWNLTKGRLKQKWAALTDDDLRYTDGHQDELLGRIQQRTGEPLEIVENTIKEYSTDYYWDVNEPFLSQTVRAMTRGEPAPGRLGQVVA